MIYSLFIAKYISIREVLALVVSREMHLEQINVKTIFLHSYLNEKINMEQPKGFGVTEHGRLVYKLKWSLYGLK